VSAESALQSNSQTPQSFSPEQKEYLAGFMAGVGAGGLFPFVGHTAGGRLTAVSTVATTANLAAPPAEDTVFGTPLGDLCKEERWKYDENPLDAWERLLAHADADKFPDAENTYRFKFHGLFYVAPAQDSFMLRLRVPACEITAAQCHGLADLARDLGNGFIDITTRGNFQLREFKPRSIVQVLTRIQDGLMAPAQVALGKEFVMPDLPQLEGVAWELMTQQPNHLLPRKFADWNALLADAVRDAVSELEKKGPLAQRRWGERNTAAICHPLAGALPSLLKRFLCMPADALPGDSNMPRVAAPDFGASERMVVSPGHEADGIIEMPGGQSGNPLSPFWGAGHEDWVHGRATPFLPGKATHTLALNPN